MLVSCNYKLQVQKIGKQKPPKTLKESISSVEFAAMNIVFCWFVFAVCKLHATHPFSQGFPNSLLAKLVLKPISINNILLGENHVYSFTYYRSLFLCYNGSIVMTEILSPKESKISSNSFLEKVCQLLFILIEVIFFLMYVWVYTFASSICLRAGCLAHQNSHTPTMHIYQLCLFTGNPLLSLPPKALSEYLFVESAVLDLVKPFILSHTEDNRSEMI